MPSRREFLRSASLGSVAAFMPGVASAIVPGPSRIIGDAGHRPPWSPPVPEDPRLRELAHRAIDAATSSGAQYADVRFTLTRTRDLLTFSDNEHVAVGVRALVNGAWGFVAGPFWVEDDVARIGQEAAQQAAQNLWNPAARVDIGTPPPVATGTWTTPIKRDPFEVSFEETMDLLNGMPSYLTRVRHASSSYSLNCERQERTVVTSDGAFFSQITHTAFSRSGLSVRVTNPITNTAGDRSADWVTPTGAGYEAMLQLTDMDMLDRLVDEARRVSNAQNIDIGRFDVVFDGYAMASLVASTIGVPSEIDRIRGFEANAGGTSYLATAADPTAPLGTRRLAPTFLTIRGNRSMSAGVGTVKWDDEGVSPDEFDIIRGGVLNDYPTTRQHVSVLQNVYRGRGQALQSHGCSGAGTAMDFPLVMPPNMVMQPSKTTASFDDLVASVVDGYAVIGGGWDMDQQGLTGMWMGNGSMVFRVKRGKIVAPVQGMALFIRSIEMWKNLVAIGDATTQRTRGAGGGKGQPPMAYGFSVSAPAAKITGIAVGDITRKLNV